MISSNTFLNTFFSLLPLSCVVFKFYLMLDPQIDIFLKNCLSACCLDSVISIILSSKSPVHSSPSFGPLVIASRLLFISTIELILIGTSLYFLVP